MKRLLFCICFLLLLNQCFAQGVPFKVDPSTAIRGWDGNKWVPIKVTEDGNLTIAGDIEIGDVSIETIPSYKDALGTPTRAIVDDHDRPLMVIASDGIGLIKALNDIKIANASGTELIAAINLVQEAIEEFELASLTEKLDSLIAGMKTELATDSIGLIAALNEIRDANASETELIAAINLVETEVTKVFTKLDEEVIATELKTDSIGLVSKLDEILEATASETELIAAINLVKLAIENIPSDGKVELATDSINLITTLEKIETALKNNSDLLSAIELVETALKENSDLVDAIDNIKPAFVDGSDTATSAKTDIDQRVLVNLDKDSVGLLDKLDDLLVATASETKLINKLDALQTATASETKLIDSIKGVPTNCSINTVSIPGNTMFLINPLPNNVAISIFNNSDSATLWVRSDDVDVTVGNGIPVQPKGFISFKHGSSPNIKIMADSGMSVTTYKEGR